MGTEQGKTAIIKALNDKVELFMDENYPKGFPDDWDSCIRIVSEFHLSNLPSLPKESCSDEIIRLESERLHPHYDDDNANRMNKTASKRRNFQEGAKWMRTLLTPVEAKGTEDNEAIGHSAILREAKEFDKQDIVIDTENGITLVVASFIAGMKRMRFLMRNNSSTPLTGQREQKELSENKTVPVKKGIDMKTNLIEAIGLDPEAPYHLGNKKYYYERECNSGHKDLFDEEIAFTGGYYDGYNWTVPVCLRCINNDKEYPTVLQHSHNKKVYLKEVVPTK